MRFNDSTSLQLGSDADISMHHDGSNGYFLSNTGNLTIDSAANDADIIFKGTDGGADITALTLDMSDAGTAIFNHNVNLPDNGKIQLGNSNDFFLIHDGSNSEIHNQTGDLTIKVSTADKDIIFKSDDGSGGVTAYLTLDGSAGTVEVAKEMNLAVPLATDQQKHVMHYQLAGYGTGDGTNYETTQNLHDTNAPFEHNTSVGADGTTALTVANMSRTGGHIMPRACTLKRWTGWATCVGSQTAYIGLFKVSFTRNDATDLSLVLLDEFSYTAMGNNAMEDFDETSFTATALAAGDMIITAIKSQSGMAQYFNLSLIHI
jgi:hypothetical protein